MRVFYITKSFKDVPNESNDYMILDIKGWFQYHNNFSAVFLSVWKIGILRNGVCDMTCLDPIPKDRWIFVKTTNTFAPKGYPNKIIVRQKIREQLLKEILIGTVRIAGQCITLAVMVSRSYVIRNHCMVLR